MTYKQVCGTMDVTEVGTMAKTTTSSEVKKRWMDKAYHKYAAYFRYDTDQHLIDFLEDNKDTIGVTQIFREALEMYMKAGH